MLITESAMMEAKKELMLGNRAKKLAFLDVS